MQTEERAPGSPAPGSPAIDRPPTPITLFDNSYREIVQLEFGQSQRAWLRILSDMQDANARWVARRQDMIRESAQTWLDPKNAEPRALAEAWRRWATASAQRWIDDVADQVEMGVKAALTISESAMPDESEEGDAKPKRAKSRSAKNGEVHH